MEEAQSSDIHGHDSTEMHDSGFYEISNSSRHSASPAPQPTPTELTLNMKNEADDAGNNQVMETNHDNSGGENTTGGGDHDQPQVDESPDQKAPDFCGQVTDQSEPLSKYRPTTKIPTFEELHQQGAVTLKDPVPGYLKFADAFDSHGRRIATRECLDAPGKAILPSNQEPLTKQMLDYCQRWGFWIAHVQDDKRRTELLNWVERMVHKQWQDAINLGYCGEPNGHKYCCLAHDLEGSDGKTAKKTNQSGDARKKTINTGRQPAPFACENGKHPYSIINQELEKCDITIDNILGRMSPEDVEKGNELLIEMCHRVERDRLNESDWKPRTGRIGFLPHVHGRNLLMFCLWEVQRCRAIVDQMNINLSKASTTFQAKNSQKRLDVNLVRAGQHLALAVILDEKRDKDASDHESEAEESDAVIDNVRRRSDRIRRSEIVIEDTDDQNDEETVVGGSEREASTPDSEDEEVDEMHLESEEAEDQEPFAATPTNEYLAPSAAPEGINADEHGVDQVGENRELTNQDQGGNQPSKRLKLRFEQTSTQQHKHSDTNTRPGVQDNKSALNSYIPPNVNWPVAGRLFPTQFMTTAQAQVPRQSQQPRVHSSYEMSSPEPAKQGGAGVVGKKKLKQAYTFEFWQPRIEAVLEERGLPPLKIPLRGWRDVKSWLEHLEFNGNDRNRLLREFKSGFADWEEQHQQYPQQVSTTTSNNPASGPTSDAQLNSTRGFHFRYFSTSTEDERAHVDDMIGEYVQAIIASRSPRFGYYAVFIIDGIPGGKELAHGFWDLTKGGKVSDADWFHGHQQNQDLGQGYARPENFRAGSEVILHQWGYSVPPPPPPSKRAKAKSKSVTASASKSGGGARKRGRGHDADDSENDGDYDYDSAPAYKKQRKRGSGKADHRASVAAVTGRKRRGGVNNIDDSDDDEWEPGY